MKDRLIRSVREFDAQGWHRTGSRVDHDSADWLVERVAEAGFEARLESFDFDRVIPGESYLEIDGERVDGFPVFDGSFTDAEGVLGRLCLGGDDGDIALVEFPPAGAADEVQRLRHSGGYRALVGVVRLGGEGVGDDGSGRRRTTRSQLQSGVSRARHLMTRLRVAIYPPSNSLPKEGESVTSEGLAVRNAEYFDTRGGPPVLQVASGEWERLRVAADSGAVVRVVAQAEVGDSSASNVIVRVPGADRGLDPLVVMTPRSGWFNCAIERGGGIACWLEILELFRGQKPVRDVIFIATSGHELGHLGLEAFLELNPELPSRALASIHLGASIGAARGWSPRLQTSDEDMEWLALRCFDDVISSSSLPELGVVPSGTVRAGEALQIDRRKGRFISVVGGHDLFHQEGDRWPEAVGVDGLEAYASALVGVVRALVMLPD